jgi:class 3 adenylate cyclase
LAIRDAVAALHAEMPEDAQLDFGVGIHYGEAVLGWIGTEKRLEYTAISDSVNTTKRIQENCAKNQILISREAYERVEGEIEAIPFSPLSVKGKTQPLDVYEVVGLK